MKQLKVHKNRTNIVSVSLGFDASQDVFTSEIRADPEISSELIASWQVAFETDGVDGELILTLDNSLVENITQSVGYMDLKRISGNEPLSVFDEMLQVVFLESITD